MDRDTTSSGSGLMNSIEGSHSLHETTWPGAAGTLLKAALIGKGGFCFFGLFLERNFVCLVSASFAQKDALISVDHLSQVLNFHLVTWIFFLQ